MNSVLASESKLAQNRHYSSVISLHLVYVINEIGEQYQSDLHLFHCADRPSHSEFANWPHTSSHYEKTCFFTICMKMLENSCEKITSAQHLALLAA